VPCHIKQTKLDMSFISIEFVALLSCCFLTFHLTRNNYRKYILLLGSGLFIGYYHVTFLIVAFLITLFTFYWGKIIQNAKNEKKEQLIYLVGIGALVGCWIAFRYAGKVINDTNWLIPLGISFYTFQAIAYLTEVYWKVI
jgi:alginate O-acetyltransferase complex protein AlgI